MDRRDALKALTTIAASTGFTVAPVTAQEAKDVTLVVIKTQGLISADQAERLADYWKHGVEGTALEGIRTVVVPPDIDIEFVRK